MSEEQNTQRRRRRATESPIPAAMPDRTPTAPPPTSAAPSSVRITASGDEPEWIVSAKSAAGASQRRTAQMPAPKQPASAAGKAAGAGAAKTAQTAKGRAGTRPMSMAPQKKAPRKKPRAKRRGGMGAKVAKGLLGAAAAAALIFGIVSGVNYGTRLMDVKKTLDKGDNTFYGNIYMNGIPLEGLTLDQAQELVNQQVNSQAAAFCITLHTQDGRSWNITAEDLNVRYSTADQIDQLWAIGHTGNARERYEQVKELEEHPRESFTPPSYDLSVVNKILTQIKSEVDVPAVNAERIDDDTKWPPFSYTDDHPGQTLDISGLNERISQMVESFTSGTVELAPTPVQAAVTREMLEGQIVKLATYETAIGATSHEGRFTNIRVGTEKFNHKIIQLNESVSFNKVTGKRTEANGFVEAPEIAYGNYVMGTGGGICQVSSTLYNCVVGAGLQVTKRTQHSLASNYVPMGQDATVSDDRLDFVFKNTSGAPLYIETKYYQKKRYWYTQFTIYGKPNPNGYSYKLESKVREVIPLPEPTYRPDKEMTYCVYTDETHQVSKGEEGYIVDVYLVTMDQKGLEISRELQYTDTYKTVAPVYYVGITPRETQ